MPQYFTRTSKALTTWSGPPTYATSGVLELHERASIAIYSPNGKYLAYSTASETVVVDAFNGTGTAKLPLPAADMYFSPKGTFIVTWTRPKKNEHGNWIPNLKVWLSSGGSQETPIQEFVQKSQGSFRGGWFVQWSGDEQFCIWQSSPSTLTVGDTKFNPSGHKLSIPDGITEFSVSRGRNPHVAVFILGTKGKPSSIRMYRLPAMSHAVAQRTVFKVDGVKLMWNKLGTGLLVWATTDHDASGKSYYGEGSLYLLSAAGQGSEQRIHLEKEGPIHDVSWSPLGDEFDVTYGYMPSKTSFFDSRGNEVHSLPLASRNTLAYSPHGRFVVSAGFGNIQGATDVYDRHARWNKITTIQANNTSYFEWSPCGRFLLTATTSPRLRVDNGVKIWHYTGKLLCHFEDDELFTVAWRPEELPLNLTEPVPAPHETALNKPVQPATAPKSAYRPPHARGSASAPSAPTSLYQRSMAVNSEPQELSKSALKNKKKRENKKAESGSPSPQPAAAAPAPAASAATAEEKQIRSLLKKYRAIQELKQRQASGDKLEATQIQKIESEKDVLKKLEGLGWSG